MIKQYNVTVNGTTYEVTVESAAGGSRMASAPVSMALLTAFPLRRPPQAQLSLQLPLLPPHPRLRLLPLPLPRPPLPPAPALSPAPCPAPSSM